MVRSKNLWRLRFPQPRSLLDPDLAKVKEIEAHESRGILGEGTSQIIFRCPATWLDNWRRALESLEDHRWFSGFLESRMCTYTFPFSPPKKWFIVENPSINGWFGGAPWIGNLWKPQHLHGPKKATTEVFQGRPEGNHRSSRRNRRRCGEWTDLSHGLKMLKMCGLIWLICIYICTKMVKIW